jgi:hypothetical protein
MLRRAAPATHFFTLRVQVRPERSIFSSALNFCRSAIAAATHALDPDMSETEALAYWMGHRSSDMSVQCSPPIDGCHSPEISAVH